MHSLYLLAKGRAPALTSATQGSSRHQGLSLHSEPPEQFLGNLLALLIIPHSVVKQQPTSSEKVASSQIRRGILPARPARHPRDLSSEHCVMCCLVAMVSQQSSDLPALTSNTHTLISLWPKELLLLRL